jgi:hypothetical protein
MIYRMNILHSIFILCIALFGAWSFLAQLLMIGGFNYNTLKILSIMPLICMAYYAYKFKLAVETKDIHRNSFNNRYKLSVIYIPIVVIIYFISKSEWVLWILSCIYLVFINNRHDTIENCTIKGNDKSNILVLLLLIIPSLASIILTLGAMRPDADDALYLSLATSAIDYPKETLLGFDSLYKSNFSHVAQSLHVGQTYEYFLAILSEITGISVHTLYYIILPSIWSPLGILSNYIFLRRFVNPIPAILGVVFIVFILTLWGDGHRTFGNFSFVRLFHGKSIFLWVLMPMIVHHSIGFSRCPSPTQWTLLLLIQCASLGLTANAIVIAPLASTLAILSANDFNRKSFKVIFNGLLASAPLILIGLYMTYRLSGVHTSLQADPLHLGYHTVFGEQRTTLVLCGLLLIPYLSILSKTQDTKFLVRYLLLSFTLLLCPIISQFAGIYIAHVFSWRILWALPVPLLLGLMASVIFSKSLKLAPLRYSLLSIWVLCFILSGQFSISSNNWSWANIGRYKVNKHFHVAEYIANNCPSHFLTLVPQNLAINLCTLPNSPPLIAVRLQYLDVLKGTTHPGELDARYKLLKYARGITDSISHDWFLSEVDRREIRTIAFPSSHSDAEIIKQSLIDRNFRVSQYSVFTIAVKS